jgi:transcriptional regulator GlxA family with amidase domain
VEQIPTARAAAHASVEHANLVDALHPARQGPASPIRHPAVAGRDQRTRRPQLSPVVNRAQSYICGHLAEPLPLVKIARIARCSRRHLCARFLLETGDTVGGYVRRVRLLCAASEIRSGAKITAVARSVGYRSYGNFVRAFRAAFGANPRTFRSPARSELD